MRIPEGLSGRRDGGQCVVDLSVSQMEVNEISFRGPTALKNDFSETGERHVCPGMGQCNFLQRKYSQETG